MIFKDIDINNLFKLMEEHDVAEVTLRDGKIAVEVKRKQEPVLPNHGTAMVRSMEIGTGVPDIKKAQAAASVEAGDSGSQAPSVDSGPAPVSHNYHTVEAPLVGTFYRSSSPETEPYVEVGDKVKTGDVLCIVEAMKSMNEIQSDINGTVREICVENSDMVEFDQVLFKIETNG